MGIYGSTGTIRDKIQSPFTQAPAVSSVVMQSVLLTGRPFLKISMRCRYTLRKPTSSFFQARNQKCRSPSLLPRQWCAKTPSPTWRKVREPVLSLSSTICVPFGLKQKKNKDISMQKNFHQWIGLPVHFFYSPSPPSFSFLLFFRWSPLYPSFGFALLSESVFIKKSKTGSLTFLYHCGAILYKLCCKTSGWERYLALTMPR